MKHTVKELEQMLLRKDARLGKFEMEAVLPPFNLAVAFESRMEVIAIFSSSSHDKIRVYAVHKDFDVMEKGTLVADIPTYIPSFKLNLIEETIENLTFKKEYNKEVIGLSFRKRVEEVEEEREYKLVNIESTKCALCGNYTNLALGTRNNIEDCPLCPKCLEALKKALN